MDTKITVIELTKLTPSPNKHLKNIETGAIHEGTIYLGSNDSASNYIEVSEEEYLKFTETSEPITQEE